MGQTSMWKIKQLLWHPIEQTLLWNRINDSIYLSKPSKQNEESVDGYEVSSCGEENALVVVVV